ncbi:unnamed protein product [Ophioblennius macclurei]
MSSAEIIVLSDDEEEEEGCEEDLSCLIVEEKVEKKPDCVVSPSSLDEDLVVTYCQRAEVLPHARYDCPLHPFTHTECEMGAPAGKNGLFCDQCYCYICDKLAASCEKWCHSGVCHCNSHKKSGFWNNLRSGKLLGRLKPFNLTLSEVDSHLRRAETMLESFREQIFVLFSSFLKGSWVMQDGSGQQVVYHDYRAVYDFVSSFLDKTDKEDGRAAAVMNLGAAEDFISHYYLDGMIFSPHSMANPFEAKLALIQRVIANVQRLMVNADFTSTFIYKLQNFFSGLQLPLAMKGMRNSLCVRPWDNVLLVSVLKGQNVSGTRKNKGKKDVLTEQIDVVQLRCEALQLQNRYRDLCRYLRVVKTDDAKRFLQLQDLIPFFMCAEGDFNMAAKRIFSTNAISRITPPIFLTYLHIFHTATVPKRIVWHPQQLCDSNVPWVAVEGAMPLKRAELVKFALMAQRHSMTIYIDSQCWTKLLTIVNTPSGSSSVMPPPSPQFLHNAQNAVNKILLSQDCFIFWIPQDFLEVCPDQALLLLVTGALAQRLASRGLHPVIPVINTFKENQWASRWLYNNLSSQSRYFNAFVHALRQEMGSSTGRDLIES